MLTVLLMLGVTARAAVSAPPSVVDLSEGTIRIGDVLPHAPAGIDRVPVARMPAGRTSVTIDRAALASLIRRAAPGVSIVASIPAAVTFRRRAAPLAGRATQTDAALPEPDVRTGQAMTLVVRSGPVTIERQVTTLQPGRNGRRAFVRSAEGDVFAAPVAVSAR